MTTTRQEAENVLVIFLRHCDESGTKPIRFNYTKWRVSDAPYAARGIAITAVMRHYGSWQEAMRQVAPAYKEWQEEDAAAGRTSLKTEFRKTIAQDRRRSLMSGGRKAILTGSTNDHTD